MEIITSRGDPDNFFLRLRSSRRRVLLLDYDGTLAPFQVERRQALPWPEVPPLLDAISGATRVVIVSGRAIQDLLPLLGMQFLPEIWGCHGWERLRIDGRYELGELPAEGRRSLAQASAWAREHGIGDHLEEKPAAVALHWRGLDRETVVRIRAAGGQTLANLARQGGLQLHEFDGGLELRFPGRNKGEAVRRVLAEEEGRGAVFAYLGDDRTDEDAFTALAGRGLNVLIRREWRPTAADLRLEPPEELLAFLHRWQEHTPGYCFGA